MSPTAPESLHPRAGARLLLERVEVVGASARYRGAIYTPDAAFIGEVRMDEDGGVELVATGAPDALDGLLIAFARLTARSAARRRGDGLPAWPARVLRWRPDPSGRAGAR
jgi:hypothetical protein